MSVIIRKATRRDIPAISKVKGFDDEQRYIQRIEIQEQGDADYLMYEEDGEVVGQVYLKYFGSNRHLDYPDIEDLRVIEHKRNQGIGTVLLKICETRAKEKGFKNIGLGVNPTLNPRARALYERLGYKVLEGSLHLSGIYNGVEDWVVDMVKEI